MDMVSLLPIASQSSERFVRVASMTYGMVVPLNAPSDERMPVKKPSLKAAFPHVGHMTVRKSRTGMAPV